MNLNPITPISLEAQSITQALEDLKADVQSKSNTRQSAVDKTTSNLDTKINMALSKVEVLTKRLDILERRT